MKTFHRRRSADSGSVAAIGALVIVALVLTVGAAVELTRVRSLGSELQDSTDGAALHAAKIAVKGAADADVSAAADTFVLAHLGEQTSPPTVATTVMSRSPVRVRVDTSGRLGLVFAGVLGRATSDVARSAVAEAQQDPICVLLLDPSASQTWSAGGSSRVVGTGCVAHVNSNSPAALHANGGAGATMKAIYVGGDVGSANGFSPKPVGNQPPTVDPIGARITWPSTAACGPGKTNTTVNSAKALTPGVYCGGVTVGNGGIARLAPGVYVIQSGDLQIKSGGKLLAPSNVTIVLTSDTSKINVLAGGTADIRAPTSGPWRGVAIAQKPQSVERTSHMQGGGELLFDGIIYLPSQKLHLTGGGDLAVAGLRRIFVARKLETAGNGKVFVSGDPTLLVETARVRIVE